MFIAHPKEVPIVMSLRYRCSLIQRLTQNDPLKDIMSKHKIGHHRNVGDLSGHARKGMMKLELTLCSDDVPRLWAKMMGI